MGIGVLSVVSPMPRAGILEASPEKMLQAFEESEAPPHLEFLIDIYKETLNKWAKEGEPLFGEYAAAQEHNDVVKQAQIYEKLAQKYPCSLPAMRGGTLSASRIYKRLGQPKNAERVLRKGLALASSFVKECTGGDELASFGRATELQFLYDLLRWGKAPKKEDIDRVRLADDNLKKLNPDLWVEIGNASRFVKVLSKRAKAQDAKQLLEHAQQNYNEALKTERDTETRNRLEQRLKELEELGVELGLGAG